MTVTLVGILFVSAALVATGVLAAAWRRDPLAALAGVPVAAAGAALASVGVARFGSSLREPASGQEAAVFVLLAALGIVVLGVAVGGTRRDLVGPAVPTPAARGRRRR
ncbi:MAG TPA: hypothetical protein VF160_00870 [Candidatus Dormibacteraeota bacterium]